MEPVPKSLLLAQTETYTEYAQDGSLIRGKEATVPKSIYPEDVYINNHTVSIHSIHRLFSITTSRFHIFGFNSSV